MKENNLSKIIEKKLFTVNRSYHESFEKLNEKELVGLCEYDSLLTKVHKELKSKVSQEDLTTFESNLKVFANLGEEFSSLYVPLFKLKKSTKLTVFSEMFLKKEITTSADFNPIYAKLINKAGADSWVDVNKCLFKDSKTLNPEAVTRLCDGFSLTDITSYGRFVDAVNCTTFYIRDIINISEFSHVLNLCNTNEKFVFVLLYPYLIKPLGKIVWTTLLPHFHFVSGSFYTFIKNVADLLKSGSLGKTILTSSIKSSAKFALGVSGVGILALFSNAFTTKTNQVLISNGRLYKG